MSTCMSQAHTTFVGYFLGYQGLEKEPEAFVSKPPQWKFSSARNSEETPSGGALASGGFGGVQRGQIGGHEPGELVWLPCCLGQNPKVSLGDPSESITPFFSFCQIRRLSVSCRAYRVL